MAQYPKLRFESNIPVRVEFKFDDCRYSDGTFNDGSGRQYDPSYAYRVKADYTDPQGNPQSFDMIDMRVTERLQETLLENGAGQGAVLDVCKRLNPETQRNFFEVTPVSPSNSPGIAVKDWGGNILRQDNAVTPASGGAQPQGMPEGRQNQMAASKEIDGTMAIDKMADTYQFCWETSAAMFARIKESNPDLLQFLGIEPTIESVTTVATSFFISADRQKLTVSRKATEALAAIDGTGPSAAPEGGSPPEGDDLPFKVTF